MTSRFASLSKVLTAFVVLALLAALFLVFSNGGRQKTVTADFRGANSLYKGGEVRVLGVPVGKIKSVEARGDHVRVTMTINGDVKIPAEAKAVEVSPAIVGDRFVQLAPAYSGGPELANGANIPIDRTAVPIELDDIFKSVDSLALALGPNGANKNGALSRLVKTSAKELDGQGQQVADTLNNFSKLSATLNNNQDALFSSISEVNKFVALLHKNDKDVRDFFDSTADVADVLAGERDDLAKTIKALSAALIDVRNFVRANRSAIRGNVDNVERLAALLANHTQDIDHLLVEAPVAWALLGAAGGGPNGTIDARGDLTEILTSYGLPASAGALTGLLGLLGIPLPVGGASAASTNTVGAAGANTPSAGSSTGSTAPTDVVPNVVNGLDSVIGNLSGMLAVN